MGLFAAESVVGLVIGPESVRAVSVSKGRSGICVTGFAELEIETDQDSVEEVSSVVDRLFSENSFARDNVVVAVNSRDAVLRQVSLPFSDEARIRKTIKFEVEDELPFAVESCIVDYHVGRTVDGRSEVLVSAVEKRHLDNLLGILEKCGIDPVSVDLDVAAVLNVAGWADVLRGPTAFLDIAEDLTRLVIWDNEVVFWRTFRTGSAQAASAAKKVSSEMERSILSSGLNSDPQALYITGTHKELSMISGMVAQSVSISSVGVLSEEGTDIAEDVSVREVLSSGAVALGCALKGAGFDISTIDFRQEEYVHRKKLDQLAPGLTVLSVLMLICGIIWNISIGRTDAFAEREAQKIRDNAVTLWKESGVTEEPGATVGSMASRLEEFVLARRNGNSSQEKTAAMSVLDEWRIWAARTPLDADIEFEMIRMDQKRITLEGNAVDVASAERLVTSLNRGGRFSFELPRTSRRRDGRIEFTLRHEYEEE